MSGPGSAPAAQADAAGAVQAAGVPGLVSVALCTYNGERFLDEQIESVLQQQGVTLELVVGDDASTDGTWQRLQAWAARDPRIHLHRHDTRLGYAPNFAHTLARCRGEFIAPCDQDDRWRPDKLARLLATLDGHLLNYCDSELIDEQGQPLGQRVSDRTGMYSGSGIVPLCFWNSISGHAMLFRRDLLRLAWPFPDDAFHDWWLAVVAANAGSVGYLPEPLVAYRQHGGNLTDMAQRRRAARDSWHLYRRRARWLQALARLPGPDQDYCRRLAQLWQAREHQWFCADLRRHLASRAADLMRLNRRERFGRFALKQFVGQRWRRAT